MIYLTNISYTVQIEYTVESYGAIMNHGCIDNKRTKLSLPNGGYVIYAVAHQHTGGVGSTLYGEVFFQGEGCKGSYSLYE